MSSAYESLALLNGGLGGVSASQPQNRSHKTTTTSVSSGRASTVTSASTGQSKQQQRLPAQFQLPHDTHLLDSLTRSTKHKQQRSTSFFKDQEVKEAYETLQQNKISTELLPRLSQEERPAKRTRDEAFSSFPVDFASGNKRSPSPLAKKGKESPELSSTASTSFSAGLDLSNTSVPEDRTKSPITQPTPPPLQPENTLTPQVERNSINESATDRPTSPEGTTQESTEHEETCDDVPLANEESSLPHSETKEDCTEGEGEGELNSNGNKGKKRRGKKSIDVGERKMLRSSAGRAAAAAARARENHSN